MFTKKQNIKNGINTIFDAISYLYILLFVGGFITFQRVGSEFRVTLFAQIFSLTARVSYLLSYFSGVVVKASDPQISAAMLGRLSPVLKVILAWECIAVTVTYVESCFIMDIHRQKHMQLLHKMQQMDNEIVRDFPYVRWNYEKSHRKYAPTTVLLGVLYFLFAHVFLFAMANCACGYFSSLLITVPYTFITASLGLIGFLHIAFIDYLRLRFRLIQTLLRQLYNPHENNKLDETMLHARIVTLFEYTKRCTTFIRELNLVFGFLTASGLFYDFAIMTNFTFVLCQKLIDAERSILESAFIALLLFMHWYKVFMHCIYGYALQKEQRNCYHALKSYGEHFYLLKHVQETVDDFQHWQMHNKFNLTFGSYLPINLNVVYVTMNSVANYALILIQLLYQQMNISSNANGKVMHKDVEIISTYKAN